MAGHALLEGCQRPWDHSGCSGFQSSPEAEGAEAGAMFFGGTVCHCACHQHQAKKGSRLHYAETVTRCDGPDHV